MSFTFGGLIIKKSDDLSNNEILALLRKENFKYQDEVTVEAGTSREFTGIGIKRVGGSTIVLGKDIPHSCSFNEKEPSKLNDRLLAMSKQREILCFTLDGVPETYGWVIFNGGKMIRAKMISGDELLSDYGQQTTYDKDIQINETGLLKLIENFMGSSFTTFFHDKLPSVKVYE